MRVSFEWLREFIDITLTPEDVGEKLTMIGLEVEGAESINTDTVFEVNITPNRPDCLSILGIARELSAALNVPLKIPRHEISREHRQSDFSVEITKPELCNRYAGRLITGVMVSQSPEWIKTRIEKCGIRSINNVVDVTNYMLLEFGHPLHAFDADTIEGNKIKIDIAGTGNKIITLDAIERDLPEDALLIWDSRRPIAVAGIMGGLYTEVTEKTKNIFLESAYFNPLSIRKTSRRLNLKSESSYRFERGTDIVFLEYALNRAALLIQEISGGTVYEIIDVYPVPYVPASVEVRCERINRLLGTFIPQNEICGILKKLGIALHENNGSILAYPPSYRRDIQRENDIAEEIARMFGYDNIPKTIPRSPLSTEKLNWKNIRIHRMREAIRKSGFTEVINYSFMSEESLDMLTISDNDRRRSTYALRNPLSQETSLLRTTLLPSLIENFKFNIDRGINDIRLFEISRIFVNISEQLPSEDFMLGGIFYKEKIPELWKEDVKSFFIAKGAIEAMMEELKISKYSFAQSPEPFLHSGQAAEINIGGKSIGFIGVLKPGIIEKLDLKKQNPEIVVFELDIDGLLSFAPESIHCIATPKYPPVERDIALVVDEDINAANIREKILSYPSELIEEVSVFDYYKGPPIPTGKKSLAFSITYRSEGRTLTDEEVEKLHSSLVDYLLKRTGGELRK